MAAKGPSALLFCGSTTTGCSAADTAGRIPPSLLCWTLLDRNQQCMPSEYGLGRVFSIVAHTEFHADNQLEVGEPWVSAFCGWTGTAVSAAFPCQA